MSNLPVGSQFESNAPWNEKEQFECPECLAPVETEGKYCSNNCFKASML